MVFTCSPDFITVGAVKKIACCVAVECAAPRYEHPMFICCWKEMCNVGINHCYQFCIGRKK